MLKNKIKKLLEKYSYKTLSTQIVKDIILYNDIISFTSFLGIDSPLKERVYCILNNIDTLTKCNHCNTNKVRFDTSTKGYRQFCSSKCNTNSKKTLHKRKLTNLKKY